MSNEAVAEKQDQGPKWVNACMDGFSQFARPVVGLFGFVAVLGAAARVAGADSTTVVSTVAIGGSALLAAGSANLVIAAEKWKAGQARRAAGEQAEQACSDWVGPVKGALVDAASYAVTIGSAVGAYMVGGQAYHAAQAVAAPLAMGLDAANSEQLMGAARFVGTYGGGAVAIGGYMVALTTTVAAVFGARRGALIQLDDLGSKLADKLGLRRDQAAGEGAVGSAPEEKGGHPKLWI